MGKIIALVGISGSGKSTRAKKIQEENPNSIIINRDKLREMLFGYTEETIPEYHKRPDLYLCEGEINSYQNFLVKRALSKNKIVILDNTHLKQRYINQLKKDFEGHDISFELVECSLEEAISRDSQRTRKVGAEVIKEQWNNLQILKKNFDFVNFIPVPFKQIEQNPNLPHAFIFDIDGTLATMGDRSPYDYSKVHLDTVNEPIFKVYQSISRDYRITICTGRKRECLKETEEWLADRGIYGQVYIRNDGDDRPDYIVKEEMWREIVKEYYIVAMIDDRKQVVDHARRLGFTVFQVDEGNF